MRLGSMGGRNSRMIIFVTAGFSIAAGLLLVYRSLLVALSISLLLAYFTVPLVNRLERKGAPRAVVAATLILLAVAVITLLGARFLPVLYEETISLLQRLPSGIEAGIKYWLPELKSFLGRTGIFEGQAIDNWFRDFSLMGEFTAQIRETLTQLWLNAPHLLGGVLNSALIPLLTFFLLKDYPLLVSAVKRLAPADLWPQLRLFALRLDATMKSVLKGQLTVALIVGLLYITGFSIIGLDYALVVGLIAGICRIVPYLDVLVGGVLSLSVLFSNFPGWSGLVGLILVFVAVQSVDGLIITPKVIGGRMGLHPGIVIASVIAFGDWWGMVGVIAAVPVVAMAKELLEMLTQLYLRSGWYRGSVEPESNQEPISLTGRKQS